MFDRVDKMIGRFEMAPQGADPLVLMVSGGSDSTALCLVARELADRGILRRGRVHVLHIDHGLRGIDSDNDVLFVERLAGLCSFAFHCVRIDIDAHSAQFGNNMESTARHLRYEEARRLLADMQGEPAGSAPQGGRIWTAHTRDDRVETFYMRSIVGTGPGGFASIAPRNGMVARPLLSCGRQELRDYIVGTVTAFGWELDPPERAQVPGGFWREDHTNHGTEGFRAFVRNRLVPVAEERNPRLGETLARSMDLIAEEDAFLDALVEEAVQGAVSRHLPGTADDEGGLEPAGTILVDIPRIGEIHPVLRRRLVHGLCKEILPEDERIERFHVERIADEWGRRGFALDLPGGARASVEDGRLVLRGPRAVAAWEARAGEGRSRLAEEALLPVPGSARLGDAVVRAAIVEPAPGCSAADYARAHSSRFCGFAGLGLLESALGDAARETAVSNEGASALLCLKVSHRREGDAMRPLGMGGAHKKLSDLFIDGKVGRDDRDEAVVVRCGSEIVWVEGLAVDDGFKAKESGKMVRIEVERESDVVG